METRLDILSKVGLVVVGKIGNEVVEGMITGLDLHRGEPIVDIVTEDEDGNVEGRFLYVNQVTDTLDSKAGETLGWDTVCYLKPRTALNLFDYQEGISYEGATLEKKKRKKDGMEITFKHNKTKIVLTEETGAFGWGIKIPEGVE